MLYSISSAGRGRSRVGFTLVEILVATAVTLILMGLCATIFGYVSEGVTASRSLMEMSDRLRNTKHRLQQDLKGVTARTVPPLKPGAAMGYFEYIEGPIGPIIPQGQRFARGYTQVGDLDDVLMFTARAINEPFVGRYGRGGSGLSGTMVNVARSKHAEIAWFMRGTSLFRRQLLIMPRTSIYKPRLDYYEYDLSMRQKGGTLSRLKNSPDAGQPEVHGIVPPHVVCNSLGDLTKREHRFGHQPLVFPYESRLWGGAFSSVGNYRPGLGLPLVAETSFHKAKSKTNPSDKSWPYPLYEIGYGDFRPQTVIDIPGASSEKDKLIVPDFQGAPVNDDGVVEMGRRTFDPWTTPHAVTQINARDGRINLYRSGSYRWGDDVILDNVFSFDVKAWDPGAPIFQVLPEVEATGGEVAQSAVVVPRDIGYVPARLRGALGCFMRDPSTPQAQLVGFGAYVDLFYMANNQGDPYDTSSGSANRKYELRLRTWESRNLGPNKVGTMPRPRFAGHGDPRSQLQGPNYASLAPVFACVYDTWSTHYERDGIDNDGDGIVDEGTNGVDDNGNGLIDEAGPALGDGGEQETAPPYNAPLRGIQVKIRAFEPDSREIREVTVVHEFLPES